MRRRHIPGDRVSRITKCLCSPLSSTGGNHLRRAEHLSIARCRLPAIWRLIATNREKANHDDANRNVTVIVYNC